MAVLGAIGVARVEEDRIWTSFHPFLCKIFEDPTEQMSPGDLQNLPSSSSLRSPEANYARNHSPTLPDFLPEIRPLKGETNAW